MLALSTLSAKEEVLIVNVRRRLRLGSGMTIAVVIAAGLVTTPASAEVAAPTTDPIEWIEAITGTESLVVTSPGEHHGDVTIPAERGSAVTLSAAGVSVDIGQPGAGAPDAPTVSENGTVSYGEKHSFTPHLQILDTHDEPVLSDGVRALIEIHDASAPREYEFALDLPAGAVLTALADGGVSAVQDGETVLVVPAPWAVDAEGSTVPTHYEVRGNTLVQHVEFDTASVFPLIADPVWFVPLIIAGGRVIGQVAINAATRAAAVRSAAAIAAKKIIKTVRGKITSRDAKRCYAGAGIGAASGAVPAVVQQLGDGTWRVGFNGNAAVATISAAVAGCISTKIK